MNESNTADEKGFEALTVEEFSSAMSALNPKKRIAIGVSGGSDSIALTLLCNNWSKQNQSTIFALTVDHRLRKESADEATSVAKWMKIKNIPHKILIWKGEKPESKIQASARKARFNLLISWCKENKIEDLILGHHLGDQEETFLMRLARGSGRSGLAGMAPITWHDKIRILRPLLHFPKQRLISYLENIGQPWIEDPSNNKNQFARIRARNSINNISGLANAARIHGHARAGIDLLVEKLLERGVNFYSSGYCLLDQKSFKDEDPDISSKALSKVLCAIGGKYYLPNQKSANKLLNDISTAKNGTLHGVVLKPTSQGILAVREFRNINPTKIFCGQELLWDGRFTICLNNGPDGTVRALGEDGWGKIKDRATLTINSLARATLPSLWVNNHPISVPHLGIYSSEVDFSATFKKINTRSYFEVVSDQL